MLNIFKTHLLAIWASIGILASCYNSSNKVKEDKESSLKTFNCENKLFLDFCSGMDTSYFNATQLELLKRGKLIENDSENLYPLLIQNNFNDGANTEIRFDVVPKFDNNNLRVVELYVNHIKGQYWDRKVPFDISNMTPYLENIRKMFKAKYGNCNIQKQDSIKLSQVKNRLPTNPSATYIFKDKNKVIEITEIYTGPNFMHKKTWEEMFPGSTKKYSVFKENPEYVISETAKLFDYKIKYHDFDYYNQILFEKEKIKKMQENKIQAERDSSLNDI